LKPVKTKIRAVERMLVEGLEGDRPILLACGEDFEETKRWLPVNAKYTMSP
jgi:hypothetical protein